MRTVMVDFKRFDKDIIDVLVTKYPLEDQDLKEDLIIEEEVHHELELDDIKNEE
ncbi:MAG: hypothetical protein KJO53_00720 [Eudoraea sp.]|nr:hypothetical protein [Eudoraea sp.]